ncbi:MBL fold metallo-hydrolase [candidate division KSB1 bacterium]|nr:MBL fold metallo-hydrolase [candidate division KSB1 bacterium]NIR69879.1 MBL fold metallo-hydrolase [candidate division KSB1 bacterium]NIS28032.1 MBL fold metallo-hydrolase [candidate division KSB1 bacterium]NIT74903.1 MBL fold metallo-hydrolase [candidate division KSB1 bacterium]NIU28687.1 MBL fold metallo-hydrolase [candidate division KSB1 bacterium]
MGMVSEVNLFCFSLLIGLSFLLSCSGVDASKESLDLPAHHTPDGFRNPYNRADRGFGEFLLWQLGRGPDEPQPIPPERIPEYQPKIVQPDIEVLKKPDFAKIQITWIGHASFLVQVAGVNVLTDPIFSERCSPFSFVGPKRFAPPGIKFEDLPKIHTVVISHNHYDHLDEATIERLGNESRFFVPLGLAEWFRDRGITNVVELDWWQSASFSDLNFHCVPAQHFSGRTPFDRNATLWAGWVIESKIGNIFFAGDTGYSPHFQEIGARFQPIKVTMIPIGAYSPRWFMGPVHVNPPEAVRVHQDVRSQLSIGMHWGTFKLSDEPPAEAPIYLQEALEKAGVDSESFIVMKFGETRILD